MGDSPTVNDPLAQVIELLRPRAAFYKLVTGRGDWAVRPPAGQPFYAAVLDGQPQLSVAGERPVLLGRGDFVLIPAARHFLMSSSAQADDQALSDPAELGPGIFHIGEPGPFDTRLLVGYCTFDSDDTALLMSLLPGLVVVHGDSRLSTLVELLDEEARAERPGRDAIRSRLLEVLLIEAFRATTATAPLPGLLRGLADARLAQALRCVHEQPERPWTVADLAREAALSRSTFFERFNKEVGMAPMEYVLSWRMALAKRLLLERVLSLDEVALRVGYSSSSSFSAAFIRREGQAPGRYARQTAHA